MSVCLGRRAKMAVAAAPPHPPPSTLHPYSFPDAICRGKSIRSAWVLPGKEGQGEGGFILVGLKVKFWQRSEVLRLDHVKSAHDSKSFGFVNNAKLLHYRSLVCAQQRMMLPWSWAYQLRCFLTDDSKMFRAPACSQERGSGG